jgi:hypothetical protein
MVYILLSRPSHTALLVTESDYDRIVRLVSRVSRPVYRFTCIDTITYWDSLLLFLPADDPPIAEVMFDDDMDL